MAWSASTTPGCVPERSKLATMSDDKVIAREIHTYASVVWGKDTIDNGTTVAHDLTTAPYTIAPRTANTKRCFVYWSLTSVAQ